MSKKPNTDSAKWIVRGAWMVLTSTILLAALFALRSEPIQGQNNISANTNLPNDQSQVYAQYEQHVIEVKFKDSLEVRVRSGVPQNTNDGAVSAADIDAILTLSAGGVWQRSHTVSEAELDELRANGEALTGRPLPDLNNYMRLELPMGMDAVDAVQQFAALDSVEGAYLVPKPVPVADVVDYATPGSVSGNQVIDPYQGYLDAAPAGVDARWAWDGINGSGAGIRICDVEYDYNAAHKDLPAVTYVGAPKDPPFADDHGTAVLSIMGGQANTWGVKGIAYGASYYFAAAKTTTGGYDVGNGVIECMNALNPGDVIIIEQQTAGPNYSPGDNSQFGLVPVEWYEPWYDDIVTAVANGMIVVEAGGNGSQDLDSGDYTSGNGGHHPFESANDSGALIVGAGKPPKWGASARSAESFSSHGSTVDIQGWGSDLVSAGYGDLYPGGLSPDTAQRNLWFRRSFGGTSGASPVVAASAAIVQANYKAKNGSAASPVEIKTLLRDTGSPQTGSKTIGPLPNLRKAIESIWGVTPTTVTAPTITPPGGSYAMPLQVTIDYGSASQNSSNTHIRYTLNGSEPGIDSFIFIPEQGDTLYLNYGVTVKAKAFQSDGSTGLVNSSASTIDTYVSTTPKVETPLINPGGGIYSQPHQVTLSTNTPGATIRYRTDGRSPSFFYPGTEYTGPITLDPGTYEIAARGYKDGYYKSDVAESGDITVNPLTLPSPTIYPNGGDFAGSVTVYMGSTVLGAEIRYTTDGSDPSQSSALFAEPIVLDQTATVKARIYLDGYTPSDVVENLFTVIPQAAKPVITPVSGTEATGSLQVSLSTTTSGATIRYTTNGVEPTSYSTIYTGPFTLGVGQHTVKAKAFLAGANSSETASADFNVYSENLVKVEAPIIDPNGGNITGSATVSLTTNTEGADIFYIINSAAEPDQLYTTPIVLAPGGSYSLRTRAKKTGMADSDISQTSFNTFDPSLTGTIEDPDVTPPSGIYTDTIKITVDGHTNPPFTVRQIYVTIDGDDPVPNSNSTNKSSPHEFNVSTSTQVKAIATQLGWTNSDVVTRDYTIQCAQPIISPPTSVMTETVNVSLSTSTPNATLYYTLDGTEPTESSTEYDGSSFALGLGRHTVKAKCFRTNFEESETATQVYVVNKTPVAPQIVTHPVDRTVDTGADATFSVTVTGEPFPAIRWQKDGVDVAGEVEPDLTIANAQAENAGEYRAIVSNIAGETTSNPATLTVNLKLVTPAFITHPLSQTVVAGTNVTFSVAVSGQPLPAIRWQKNGVDIPGETGTDLVLSNVQPGDAGLYRAVASNSAGEATSSAALLTIEDAPLAPQITKQPESQTVAAGATATFQIAVIGDPVPSIQWQKNGTDIPGAVDPDLTISNVQTDDVGLYRAIATNSAGTATSDAAALTIAGARLAPQFTGHPNGRTVAIGESATFKVTVIGEPAPAIRWQKDGVDLPGQAGTELTLSNVQQDDTGLYRAVATNSVGEATSNGATLAIAGAPVASTVVFLNEVYYRGNGGEDWVEFINTGSEAIDIGEWWLCARFQYGKINTLPIIVGNDYVLDPGEILVVRAHTDLDNNASDLGLYTTDDFTSSTAMVDFVQWGAGQDVGRSDVAEAKGVWRQLSPGQYDFVSTAAAGQSTAWLGSNSGGGLLTFRSDWANQPRTQGRSNQLPPESSNSIYLPLITR